MKGIDLAKEYYIQYGKQMLEENFQNYLDKISIGLVGEGSECFLFDDSISLDHDFDMGFCIFISQQDYDEIGFKLERAYAHLPKEFMGFKRQFLSPVGGNRRGVIITEEFYQRFLGIDKTPNDINWWFFVDSISLATATNGLIFNESKTDFTLFRDYLLKGYPEDVRKKKLSAHLILAGQSGQYNYERLIKHGELGGANLAIFEFVNHAIDIIYLLNNKYKPFYKWAFRGLRELEILSNLEPSLEGLLEYGNSEKEWQTKCEIIEDISSLIIEELKRQNLTKATCNNLKTHAYSVLDSIADANVRNMHIMDGV